MTTNATFSLLTGTQMDTARGILGSIRMTFKSHEDQHETFLPCELTGQPMIAELEFPHDILKNMHQVSTTRNIQARNQAGHYAPEIGQGLCDC
jgi:hypothetical protein